MFRMLRIIGAACLACVAGGAFAQDDPQASAPGGAQDDADSLAKKLSNPIADLISIPLQFNYNGGIGPDEDGSQVYVNVQPVIPFTLNDDWNVISRTILPVIHQSDVFPGAGTQFGLGDITQSLFFSPSHTMHGF